MSAVFTPTRYKLSVEGYHRLGDAGILSEDSRVELLEGELIERGPIGGLHMVVVNRLTKLSFPVATDAGGQAGGQRAGSRVNERVRGSMLVTATVSSRRWPQKP